MPYLTMARFNAHINIAMTPAMKAALEVEAWESGLKLTDYVRSLLESRGKFARTVGKSGGYHVMGPAGSSSK
jgi:hypothetical protein